MTPLNPYVFDFRKALQATAVLVRADSGSAPSSYLRILKLLYIAERRCIEQRGVPISGDRFFALEKGPVNHHVMNLIKNRHDRSAEWFGFIETDQTKIKIVRDPGNGALSQFEIDALQWAVSQYSSMDEWDIVDATHEFPEWKETYPGDSRAAEIPFELILKKVGWTEAQARELIQEAERDSELSKFL